MDTLLLARPQFATTMSIHFLSVVVTLGPITLLVGPQTPWMLAGNQRHGRLVSPFAANTAPAMLALVAVHGATFHTLRLPVALAAALLVARVALARRRPAHRPLRLLGRLALPLLPALLGFQLMCWWVFRGRTGGWAPVYW